MAFVVSDAPLLRLAVLIFPPNATGTEVQVLQCRASPRGEVSAIEPARFQCVS